LRAEGKEFGATTGRPRRCGWIDIPALKYAILLNGVTQLIMTKSDVLSIFDEIEACTHYIVQGKRTDSLPFDLHDAQPVYTKLPGWKVDLTQIKDMDRMPTQLLDYIEWLEKELEVPIKIVSVGPDRNQTLYR